MKMLLLMGQTRIQYFLNISLNICIQFTDCGKLFCSMLHLFWSVSRSISQRLPQVLSKLWKGNSWITACAHSSNNCQQFIMCKLDALSWEKVSKIFSIYILLIKPVNSTESVHYIEIRTLSLHVFYQKLDSFHQINFCVQYFEHLRFYAMG